MSKNTVKTFLNAKGKSRLSMLTAYDYTIASLIDEAGIDGILVGDSLGMVMLGYNSTLPVTMEDMIHHCKPVALAVKNALLVCDMPFMSFQCGIRETLENAGRLIKEGGADAVKLEGGKEFRKEIEALARASIPVMGHLGLLPQSIRSVGSYSVQAKTLETAKKLIEDAHVLEDSGAFAIVLECVPWQLARLVTEAVNIPIIGIGSGAFCDGQILVWQDMLGLNRKYLPGFVKKFAEAGEVMEQAIRAYNKEVKNQTFPDKEHSFAMQEEEFELLKRQLLA